MIPRDEAIARIRSSRSLWSVGNAPLPEWLIASVQAGAPIAMAARPRASTSDRGKALDLARQVVALAEKKAEEGDPDGAVETLSKLLKRSDLPDDVRALLTKARDRLAGKRKSVDGDDKPAKDDEGNLGALAASIERLKRKVAAMRGETTTKKETKTMSRQQPLDPQNYNRATMRDSLKEVMGTAERVPDIRIIGGQVVIGAITREEAVILRRLGPGARHALALAEGADKRKLWRAAKKAVA